VVLEPLDNLVSPTVQPPIIPVVASILPFIIALLAYKSPLLETSNFE
jgi:hypothetical protein